MQQIALYLDKFNGLLPPDYIVRTAVCEILTNDLKLKVTITNVSVRGTRIYINGDGYLKNEIFQNQNHILKLLKERLRSYKVDRVG